MSHLRRVGGRFVTHDAHSTYTRALVAPAATWKKDWVTPAGLPVGSNYKVLKWVRSDEKQEFSDEDSDDEVEGYEENEAPTLVLPAAPVPEVALRSSVKPEPSPVPEATPSSLDPSLSSAPIPSASTLSAPSDALFAPPPSLLASSSTDLVVDSPAAEALAAAPAGEASVLPSGEMAITAEDGADPAGEARRIVEASLEGPPEDGLGTPKEAEDESVPMEQ